MTARLRARFDGQVFVPEEPVDVPIGQEVVLTVAPPPVIPDRSIIEERLERLRLAAGRIKRTVRIPTDEQFRESIYPDRV